MTEKLRKIEAALREDKVLAEKFKAELKRLFEEKGVANKDEAAVKAAQEVGFDVSLADLDKAKAAAQELDPDEMSKVAGGDDDKPYDQPAEFDCMFYYKWYQGF